MKKAIKFILIIGIIIIILMPIFGSARGKYDESQVLEGLLKELNGEFLEGDINMGGIILEEFLGQREIKSLAREVRSKMDLVEEVEGLDYHEDFISEENFNQVSIYGYDPDKNPTTIMISSYINPNLDKGETSLFINTIKKRKNFKISGIIEKMENVFEKFNKPIEITSCLIGVLDENIEEKDIIKGMNKFKVNIVEEYIDESIISYTAYTPLIDNSIFSGRKEVNLNVAIRHNEEEDKNYIWIGTPIITTGY